MKSIFTFLLLLAVHGSALAEDVMYQWTDENGVVHFSSQPAPPGIAAEEKILKSAPKVGTVAPQPLPRQSQRDPAVITPDQARQEELEWANKLREAGSPEEALAIECAYVQNVINKLTQLPQIQAMDAEGNIRNIDKQERQQRLAMAREIFRNNCNT